MSTLSKSFLTRIKHRNRELLRTGEAGLQTAEVVYIVIGSLVIAGLVIAGITAFVNGQLAQLPG